MRRGGNRRNDVEKEVDILTAYMKEVEKIPLLSREEEVELAKKAAEGDKDAINKLVESNLRFVITVAKKYQGMGLPLIDLINEGNIGLITAAKHFDWKRGYHFISYAVWWIRQAILKALADKSRLIRLPANRTNELVKIERFIREYETITGEQPTAEKIAEVMDMSEEDVKKLLIHTKSMLSLDAQVYDDGDKTVEDTVKSDAKTPEDHAIQTALKNDIEEVLKVLPQREKEIIKYRFGLYGGRPMSLREIGEKFNLTKERIRQLEKRALEKIKEKLKELDMEAYMMN